MQRTLKGIRSDMGITQKEMANKLGISEATYCKKEKGKRPLMAKELYMISMMSGVPMEEIEITA